MAIDYIKYNHLDDFEARIAKANPELYSSGRTGYEQYYIDIEGFWRDLYNPFEDIEKLFVRRQELMTKLAVLKTEEIEELNEIENKNKKYYLWNSILTTIESTEDTVRELVETSEKDHKESIELKEKLIIEDELVFGWARAVYEDPSSLNFWFDFLDNQGELSQFSVPALGVRTKVEKDD